MPKLCVVGGPAIDSSSPSTEVADGDDDLEAISVHNLLVGHVRAQTTAGKRIQRYVDAQKLLPDEFTAGVVADRLAMVESGWILVNFPRTVKQAQLLAKRGHEPDLLIELVLTEEETVSRFGWGQLCPNCADGWLVYFQPPSDPSVCRECGTTLDHPPDPQRREEIVQRIANYREQTDPLVAHYQALNKFLSISATGDHFEVADRLKAATLPA